MPKLTDNRKQRYIQVSADLIPRMKQAGPFAVMTYMVLCDYAERGVFPTQEKIADILGVTQPSIHSALIRLESMGIIKRTKKGISLVDSKRWGKPHKDTKATLSDNPRAFEREINAVFSVFNKINPTLAWGHAGGRNAMRDLIREHGLEQVVAWAELAVSVQGEPYSPVITTPYALSKKLADLAAFQKKKELTNGH